MNEVKQYREHFNGNYLMEFKLSPLFNTLVPYQSGNIKDDLIFNDQLIIYSSVYIEGIFKSKIDESNILKPIKKKLIECIDKKRILIGYSTPSKFAFYYNRIKFTIGIKDSSVLGHYVKYNETVYIILDDNVNVLGNEIRKIDVTLAHEMVHFAASQNNISFVKYSFKNFLMPYYVYIIKESIKLLYDKYIKFKNNNLSSLSKTCSILINQNERKINSLDLVYNRSINIWTEYFNDNFSDVLSIDECNDLASYLVYCYYKNFNDINQMNTIKLKKSLTPHINSLDSIFLKAYKNIGVDAHTIPGQEILFPSEITSISNQNGLHKEMIDCINKIKL